MVLSSRERNRLRPGLGQPWRTALSALVFGPILAVSASGGISLSHEAALHIGRKVWQNECDGTISGLTSWNAGENFASLGIGHFIWYPAGARGPFEESFPQFVHYAQEHNATIPEVVRKSSACPWSSRADFLAAASSPQMKELRSFLAGTIGLQADFLARRLRDSLSKMLAAAPPAERPVIEDRFNQLANRSQGCYALIDYVNFKGEGVLETERYHGQGWGLLQVLEGMPNDSGSSAVSDFADSAEKVLRQRVKNSPPDRHEDRWLAGWLKRVNSYR